MELSAHNIIMIHIIALVSFIAGIVSGILVAGDKNSTRYGHIVSIVSGCFTAALIRYFTGG